MAELNNTIILNEYLEKIKDVYGEPLRFDETGYKKYGYVVGSGGIIMVISERDDSLTMQVFEKMSLENVEGYLTYHGWPQTSGGFSYKRSDELHEILKEVCNILLEEPSNIDSKRIKREIMNAECTCYKKYHALSKNSDVLARGAI